MTKPRPAVIRAAVSLWCGAALFAAAPFAGLGRYSAAILAGASACWFLHSIRESGTKVVVGALVVWAFVHSAAIVGLSMWAPEQASRVIPNGPEYWAEMIPYVAAGAGIEADPSRFIPLHLLHLAGFAVLSAISAGLAGLVLGAYLTGYMSYYVAQVGLHASHPLIATALAWHPWAVIRVVSFILLGVSLSRLWSCRSAIGEWWRTERASIAVAMALWLGDLSLKITLAPWWSEVLRSLGGVTVSP